MRKKNDKSRFIVVNQKDEVIAYEDSLKAIAIELGKTPDCIRNKYAYDRKHRGKRKKRYRIYKAK